MRVTNKKLYCIRMLSLSPGIPPVAVMNLTALGKKKRCLPIYAPFPKAFRFSCPENIFHMAMKKLLGLEAAIKP